jgi:DUF4097 and DUF4098 domain-containing protein YvlB
MQMLTWVPRTAALLALSAAPLLAQDRRASIDTTFAFDANGRVTLSIVSGEVRVSSWDRNEIRVVASTERGTLVSEFSRANARLEVRAVDREMGRTRYEVTVPAGARVNTRGVSATVQVRDVRGELSLNTVSGNIEVSGSRARTELETVSGRITLQDHEGNAALATVSGAINAERVRGELDLRTVSGRVRVDQAALSAVRHKSVSGGFELNGTLSNDGRSSIETHSGAVTLRVPATFAATVEMQSFSGELNSDFAVMLQPGSTGGRGRRMEVAVNGGGARLAIKTFSGDIFLRKSNAAREEND